MPISKKKKKIRKQFHACFSFHNSHLYFWGSGVFCLFFLLVLLCCFFFKLPFSCLIKLGSEGGQTFPAQLIRAQRGSRTPTTPWRAAGLRDPAILKPSSTHWDCHRSRSLAAWADALEALPRDGRLCKKPPCHNTVGGQMSVGLAAVSPPIRER